MSWLFRKWCEWSHVHEWTSVQLLPSGYRMFCHTCNRMWRTREFDELEEKELSQSFRPGKLSLTE